ncbi:hypothetical protein VDGD_20158 [Verticillium dahliae]|nr:hypothetical protein VDGD_20158 [Verticillium dahliae]
MDSIFRKVERGIDAIFGDERHSHTKIGHECHEHHPTHHASNRYQSFAPQSTGNAKWYVDGCSYFWAVSEALENARESIYILDWWLSPEIYLRRPPAANERYRLDNMLKAAAERGVKVSIIVYREVEAALTSHEEAFGRPAPQHQRVPPPRPRAHRLRHSEGTRPELLQHDAEHSNPFQGLWRCSQGHLRHGHRRCRSLLGSPREAVPH